MHNPMSMAGRRVLVTGASSGIGRAAALLLSQLGAKVIVSGRDADRLRETFDALEGDGHHQYVFDVGQGDSATSWIKEVAKEVGPLHGLAHCAGIQGFQPIRVVSASQLEEMYRVNTISAAMLLKGFQAPGCFEPPASVVLVASTAAIMAAPANGGYGATKAGLIALARTFAIELVPKKIRVNCVAPAIVMTEMVERTRTLMSPEAFESMLQTHPWGPGEPIDVANAIAFLLSDASKWVTGTSLVLDGGHSA
jgi:NAD(P)-dependent dehydrogenase (short-subunit alcohol dehydrogenase family)